MKTLKLWKRYIICFFKKVLVHDNSTTEWDTSECSYVNWMSAKIFNNFILKFIEGGIFLEK